MENIYHGCITENADGTNKIIGPGEKCLVRIGKCFRKDPRDIKKCNVKQEVVAKRSLLRALRTTTIICDKSNGSIAGC